MTQPGKDFPGGSDGKASAYNAEDPGLIGKVLWRRKRQPIPVLLPGKSHGRRSLASYSPWGPKELDLTERLHFYFQPGKGRIRQGREEKVEESKKHSWHFWGVYY